MIINAMGGAEADTVFTEDAIAGRVAILGQALQLALEKQRNRFVKLLLEHAQQPPSGQNVREALQQVLRQADMDRLTPTAACLRARSYPHPDPKAYSLSYPYPHPYP